MQIARVIGDVVSTRKDDSLAALKLLVVQPLTPERAPAGRPIVAVDAVGAGVGEEVFFVRGKEASFPFHPAEPAADTGSQKKRYLLIGLTVLALVIIAGAAIALRG